MKAKIFTCAIAAGCMLGGIVFGQSVQLSGTVTCRNSNQIELKCDGESWVVKIVPGNTTINPPSATVGTKAIVTCMSRGAQRKESPTWTPAPCSTPKPTATPGQ